MEHGKDIYSEARKLRRLPREVKSLKEFRGLFGGARELRIYWTKEGYAKLKLRTERTLFTYKANPSEVDRVLKDLKIPVREINKRPKG